MERTFSKCARPLSRTLFCHSASRSAARSFVSLSHPAQLSQPARTAPQLPTTRQRRNLHSTGSNEASRPPKSHRRSQSAEETQADFSALDVLRNTAAPATSIDACTHDGFALNNNAKLSGCGVLLVGGEAYRWRPWLGEHRKEGTIEGGAKGDDDMTGRLLNSKGQWDAPEEAWGLLELVWPKPGMQRLLDNIAI